MRCATTILLGLVLAVTGERAVAYEEPQYTIVGETADYEIRRYEPYIVAEVDVDGSQRSAGNSAFRILAGYIFGDNRARTKMAMTTPVESQPISEKMQMTAPVETVTSQPGNYVYAFVMERKYTLESLPEPNDPRIRIVTRPARTMAVRRFSGSWREGNYSKNETALLTALADDGVTIVGGPVFARYNGPFTPTFMRRNEILIEVAESTAASR
ncbi:MAG: heme-binding protein [Woeseiaceae bacterium]|nr:heme-binding protein [Woeseiaceae bacterium]